ncbi:MAG TPA: hypothetical protein DEP42_00340 [Ruminococcaceae bacterium]|nr:hypothetical protein [Oscillospiraceae bacterium]
MNSESSFGRYVASLHRIRRSFMAKRLQRADSLPGLYFFLIVLEEVDGMNQGNISARLRIDKTATCKALKKLELDGYVHREIDPNDRRAHRVFLTMKGRQVLPQIHRVMEEWDASVTDWMDVDAKKALTALLLDLADKAKEALANLVLKEEINESSSQ